MVDCWTAPASLPPRVAVTLVAVVDDDIVPPRWLKYFAESVDDGRLAENDL